MVQKGKLRLLTVDQMNTARERYVRCAINGACLIAQITHNCAGLSEKRTCAEVALCLGTAGFRGKYRRDRPRKNGFDMLRNHL